MYWFQTLRELLTPGLMGMLALAQFTAPAAAQQTTEMRRAASRQEQPLPLPASLPRPSIEPASNAHGHLPASFERSTPVAGQVAATAQARDDAFDRSGAHDTLGALDPDFRSEAERSSFQGPPAGHDPQLFQIEDVDPGQDRRIQHFFEADPFQQIGWRLGAFVLFQDLELASAWQGNVFLEPDQRVDQRFGFKSETRVVSNWANHALEFRMLHDRTYHNRFSSENDAQQLYELRGGLDITRQTRAEVQIAHEKRQESRGAPDDAGTGDRMRPDVATNRVAGALNHRFNRLSLGLRGGYGETRYEAGASGIADPRNTTVRSIALRAQWEFRPTFSAFGEVEHIARRHPGPATSDGLRRNSGGERHRAGVALGQSGEFLRGEAGIGYGVQRLREATLPDAHAFLMDANVAWRITPITSMLFAASTQIDETTLAGASGVVNRRIGARLRHYFSRRFLGETGLSYGTQDYRGSPLHEWDVTLKANAEYTVNRHVSLFGGYEHVRYRSNADGRDYNASTLMLGARVRN